MIRLCQGKYLELEPFTGTASGEKFPGVRFRVGGVRRRATVAAMPARRIPELVAELQRLYAEAKFQGDFYNTRQWHTLRYKILRRDGYRCAICGATDNLHVDHRKPRSLFPELAMDPTNLRTLCAACNLGKSDQ